MSDRERARATRKKAGVKDRSFSFRRRCNVSLVAGVLTTIAVIGILTTIVFDTDVKLTNETLMSHFYDKFILGLFVEISSLFFLALYKYGLVQIKLFHNEITNIEMKFLSLDSAISSRNEDLINSVISAVSKTGRNVVLDKGQAEAEK